MDAFWEFMGSDTAPWWTGLLGVAIGAVSGVLGAGAADRRRFRDQDRRRWDERLKELFVSLRRDIDELYTVEYTGYGEDIDNSVYRIREEIRLIGDRGLNRTMDTFLAVYDKPEPKEDYMKRVESAMEIVQADYRRCLRIETPGLRRRLFSRPSRAAPAGDTE